MERKHRGLLAENPPPQQLQQQKRLLNPIAGRAITRIDQSAHGIFIRLGGGGAVVIGSDFLQSSDGSLGMSRFLYSQPQRSQAAGLEGRVEVGAAVPSARRSSQISVRLICRPVLGMAVGLSDFTAMRQVALFL